MHIAHLLRKFNPAEWGGTETALLRLFQGLREHDVRSVVYCPELPGGQRFGIPPGRIDQRPSAPGNRANAELDSGAEDAPLTRAGCKVRRFKSCLPVWGVTPQRKDQMIAVGGNLMSFSLVRDLWREPGLAVVHTHTLGRLGGIALTVAKRRRLPFVVTIHGGALDLPPALTASFNSRAGRGWEWGRLFGLLFQARRLFVDADAIIACNPKEARLLQQQLPEKLVLVHPHGVPAERYQRDCRDAARTAFPQICNRRVLLALGRIDPVKNQGWLIEQAQDIFHAFPDVRLVLAGACTNAAYGASLEAAVKKKGLEGHVLFTGGLPPEDPRLIGLIQQAEAVVLPSLSETFGLVILEAWAAGTPVIANRTSGATALIEPGRTGWLFELAKPAAFHEAVHAVLQQPGLAQQIGAAGARRVVNEFDTSALAWRLKGLYEQLIEAKHALRHSPRR